MRKWRITKQAVCSKHDEIAHFSLDAIVVALAGEITLKPLFGDIGFDRQRIAGLAGGRESSRVEVGREKLDLRL